MRRNALLLLFIAGLLAVAAAAQAPPEKKSAFAWTFSERIRQESSDNVTSLNEQAADSSAYVRFRTSLGLQWKVASGFDLSIRMTNENRYYLVPKSDPRIKKNFDVHEVFFDALNLKWAKPLGFPFTLTVGRQDIQLGEGFVIMDGGPLDGSRSAYFNAVRVDWPTGGKSALTGFYLFQPRTDTSLPVINDWGQAMVEQAEEGYGAYWTGFAGKTTVEGYLFRKNVRAYGGLPEAHINTLGGRVRAPLAERWSLTAEAAVQSGKLRRGFGGYVHLDHETGAKFPLPAQLVLGGIFLSGDDPASGDRIEGWDPAFSRWPKWSESQIYLFAKETRPAYWTNLTSLYGTAVFSFAENARLLLTWHELRAPEYSIPTALLSGSGKKRGSLFIARLNYEINRNIQGHLVWDYFRPGNYYFEGAQPYSWVRFELLFRY
jgi:hypothetical protein